MKRGFVVPMLIAALAAGCGSGGPSSPPTAPLPGSIAEVEPNDAAPQALGALGATDVRVSGIANGRGDVDVFSFTIGSTSNVLMSLSWTGIPDLEVGIADASGLMLHNQDSPSANPELCKASALPPGTYRVRVGSHTASAVGYLLIIGLR